MRVRFAYATSILLLIAAPALAQSGGGAGGGSAGGGAAGGAAGGATSGATGGATTGTGGAATTNSGPSAPNPNPNLNTTQPGTQPGPAPVNQPPSASQSNPATRDVPMPQASPSIVQPGTPGAPSSGGIAPGNRGVSPGAALGGGAAGAGIDPDRPTGITAEQRSEIERAIEQDNPPRTRGPNLVGLAVPDRTPMRDLPDQVTRIVPTYKKHKYYMVGRDLVIVEPDARQVVEVIRLKQPPTKASTKRSPRQ